MVPSWISHNAPTSSQSFMKYFTTSARFSMSAGERAIPFSFLHNFPEVWAKPILHPYQRTLPSDSMSLCISCLLANDAYSLSLTLRLMTLNMTSGHEAAIFNNFSFFRRQKRSWNAPYFKLRKYLKEQKNTDYYYKVPMKWKLCLYYLKELLK